VKPVGPTMDGCCGAIALAVWTLFDAVPPESAVHPAANTASAAKHIVRFILTTFL
jgi:hypothetical protein